MDLTRVEEIPELSIPVDPVDPCLKTEPKTLKIWNLSGIRLSFPSRYLIDLATMFPTLRKLICPVLGAHKRTY